MLNGLSPIHLLIVLAAFVLLFGAKRLPDAARGFGRSLRIFRSELNAPDGDERGGDAAKHGPGAGEQPRH